MAKTREQKKLELREQILRAAQIYSSRLTGHVFLFVYGTSYFEVVFRADRFLHLTGVETSLSASDFYKKAKTRKLTAEQFYFSNKHPFETAKQKLPCLQRLPELTENLVCVVRDFKTVTLTYKIGLTNLDFTLGLTENTDISGNRINDWFVPRTLRAKDKAIENSGLAEFVDFVFEKEMSEPLYSRICYQSEQKELPDNVLPLLSPVIATKTAISNQEVHI